MASPPMRIGGAATMAATPVNKETPTGPTGGGGPPAGIDAYAFRNTDYDVKPWVFGTAPVAEHKDLQDTGERVTMAIKAHKGCGKSNAVVNVPRPNAGRFAVITFDETTRESTLSRFKAIENQIEPVEMYEVTRPAYEGKGKDRRCVYKGYDQNDWRTAEAVLSQTVRILRRLEQEGGVENLYLDHLGLFFEGPAGVLSKQEKNPMDDDKMALVRWGRRTELMKDVLARAWRIPSHFLGVSGYGERETLVSAGKDDKGKTTVNKGGVKHPTWYLKVQENFLVTLEGERTQFLDASAPGSTVMTNRKRYEVYVEDSRLDRFPDNQTFDITNQTLAAFWQPTLPPRIA